MEVYLDGRALDSREALHQALSALLAVSGVLRQKSRRAARLPGRTFPIRST